MAAHCSSAPRARRRSARCRRSRFASVVNHWWLVPAGVKQSLRRLRCWETGRAAHYVAQSFTPLLPCAPPEEAFARQSATVRRALRGSCIAGCQTAIKANYGRCAHLLSIWSAAGQVPGRVRSSQLCSVSGRAGGLDRRSDSCCYPDNSTRRSQRSRPVRTSCIHLRWKKSMQKRTRNEHKGSRTKKV